MGATFFANAQAIIAARKVKGVSDPFAVGMLGQAEAELARSERQGDYPILTQVAAPGGKLNNVPWVGMKAIESQASDFDAAMQAGALFERAGALDAAERGGRMAERRRVYANGKWPRAAVPGPPASAEQSGETNVRQTMARQGRPIRDRAYRRDPHFSKPVDLDAPRTGVLHTTEGEWDGSLTVFRQHYAPHFLLGMDRPQGRVRIAQLFQIGTIGAALVTHNWIPLVQVEMIGFSKETLWRPDDETAEAMAALMAVCKAEYGIPLSHPWPDGDFGRAGMNPHRAAGKFGHVAGWYGHGDCPSPDTHWDPGALEWSHLFALAKAMPEANAAPSPAPDPPPRPCANYDLSTDAGLTAALATLDYGRAADLESAVKAFQAHDSSLDGIAGPSTKAAIVKALGTPA